MAEIKYARVTFFTNNSLVSHGTTAYVVIHEINTGASISTRTTVTFVDVWNKNIQ